MPRLKKLFLLSIFLLVGCSEKEADLVRLQGDVFGTSYSISYPPQEKLAGREEIQRKVDSRLKEIDNLMSTWNKNSQLSRFNRLAAGKSMRVEPDLIAILVLSRIMNKISEGAFDITVGPIVNLWGFGPQQQEREPVIPSEEELRAAQAQIGMDNLQISGNKLTKRVNLYLDLSAIAKGYAVDEISKLLQRQGVENYLVEIGGELFVRGRKANGDKWRVAIEEPSGRGGSIHKTIELENLGMATSGDYRNYYEEDGVRYSHTIDPRTLRPISHNLASATVVHQNIAVADALATALMVMGTQKALDFAERSNLAVYLISREEKGFVSHASQAFSDLEKGLQW